jgi:hypothetical protein
LGSERFSTNGIKTIADSNKGRAAKRDKHIEGIVKR